MSRNEVKALNISDLDHIGIPVQDIEKAADFYSRALGIGPFQIHELNVTEGMLRGVTRGPRRTGKLKIGVAPKGGINIELIEVMDGGTIYREFLDSNGSMMHHLGFEVNDLEQVVATIESRGIEVPFSIKHSHPTGHKQSMAVCQLFPIRRPGGMKSFEHYT